MKTRTIEATHNPSKSESIRAYQVWDVFVDGKKIDWTLTCYMGDTWTIAKDIGFRSCTSYGELIDDRDYHRVNDPQEAFQVLNQYLNSKENY